MNAPLVCTSFLLLFSSLFVNPINSIETWLKFIMIVAFVVSIANWCNHSKGSMIYTLDTCMAHVIIVAVSAYVILFKKDITYSRWLAFILCLLVVMIAWDQKLKLKQFKDRNDWITAHSIFHIAGAVGITIAFIK
jgi:uncharacterized membrane protein YfcA